MVTLAGCTGGQVYAEVLESRLFSSFYKIFKWNWYSISDDKTSQLYPSLVEWGREKVVRF